MPRLRATPLRETPNAAPPTARVIDAKFTVVGRKRGILRAVWTAFVAVAIAAAIGFAIPPLFVLTQDLMAGG